MEQHSQSLDGFLEAEEHNLRTSLKALRPELELFSCLDRIYLRAPTAGAESQETAPVVLSLFRFVHSRLYFATACLLRCHLTESLSAMRSGIDGSLAAYRVICEPESAAEYLERGPEFMNIKAYVKRVRKESPDKYPLAAPLIPVHERCSQYGSHADVSTLGQHIEFSDDEDGKGTELLLHYFDLARRERQPGRHLVQLVQAFFLMFRILESFFRAHSRVVLPAWERGIEHIEPALREATAAYRSQG